MTLDQQLTNALSVAHSNEEEINFNQSLVKNKFKTMGLDTSHDAYHGPYSSFNQMRYWLGEQIGINLREYKGWTDNATKDLRKISHEIIPLLDHSDCDGELTAAECKKVAAGLKKIIEKAEVDKMPFSNYQRAITFMKGCEKAAKRKQKLRFG